MKSAIATKPAVYALERLHAELGGKIKDNKREGARLAESMKHVEAVIRLLAPDFDTRRIAARRKNRANPYFKRGTVFRAVLGVLRDAPSPMSAGNIVAALFRLRGIEKPAVAAQRTMFGAVHSSLRNHDGKSVETVGKSRPSVWRLKVGAE
jgi:hypothetical protein